LNVLPVANQITETDINSPACKGEGRSAEDVFTSVLLEAESTVSEKKPVETNVEEHEAQTDRPEKNALYSIMAMYVPIPAPEAEPIVNEGMQGSAAFSPIIRNNESPQPALPVDILPEYINDEAAQAAGFTLGLIQGAQKEAAQNYITEKDAVIFAGTQGEKDTDMDIKSTTEINSTNVPPNNVISILESKKEAVSQSENPDMSKGLPADERPMARMPQENIIIGAENRYNPGIVFDAGDIEDLCPLENENETETAPSAANAKTGNIKDEAGKEDDLTSFITGSVEGQRTLDISPEKFIAEQEFGIATEEAYSIDNLFDAMVEKIEFLRTDGSDKMEVRLKPEHLGKITIELASSDDGLKVRIRAEDPQVKNLLGGQINQLLEALNEKGLRVSDVNVVYGGIAGQSSEQPATGKQEKRRTSSRILTGIESTEPAGGIEQSEMPILIWDKYDAHDMEPTISSVEYRA
jgi:hypothetical protein